MNSVNSNLSKKINIIFLKDGVLKIDVPAHLEDQELIDFCQNILDEADDTTLVNALSDVSSKNGHYPHGRFDADNFHIEKLEDALTCSTLHETKTYQYFGDEDAIENLEYENKMMAQFLEKSGYTQEQITNICVGSLTEPLLEHHENIDVFASRCDSNCGELNDIINSESSVTINAYKFLHVSLMGKIDGVPQKATFNDKSIIYYDNTAEKWIGNLKQIDAVNKYLDETIKGTALHYNKAEHGTIGELIKPENKLSLR